MSIIGSILTMLLMLSILVIVHELGHYLAARMFKVKVKEFSIFMGPKIYSRIGKKTGVKFSLRAIPLGGYCAMEDENGEEDEKTEGSFYSKPKRVRAAIFFAGPLMNILLALILVFIIFSIIGYSTNTIGVIQENGLFAGYSDVADPTFKIETDDKILDYDGHKIFNYTDLQMFLAYDKDYISVVTIQKADGTTKECTFDRTPVNDTEGMKPLGIALIYEEHPSVLGIIWNSIKYLFTLVRSIIYSLYWIITGAVSLNTVTGPVGITTFVDEIITAKINISDKILTLTNMAALISVNLGIFNLIPFPGLDGGQLAMVGIEAARKGKKIPPEKQGLISFIGLAVVILLGVVVMGNDIWQIISGNR